MVKVDGSGKFERVSGTNLGGGTFLGLCRLLTGVKNFDEMLKLSSQGDSANIDMLVGDIYGGRGYEDIGLSADMIACSFGKVISEDKDLKDFRPAGAHGSSLHVLYFCVLDSMCPFKSMF
jgi:type II pantothenate kinase